MHFPTRGGARLADAHRLARNARGPFAEFQLAIACDRRRDGAAAFPPGILRIIAAYCYPYERGPDDRAVCHRADSSAEWAHGDLVLADTTGETLVADGDSVAASADDYPWLPEDRLDHKTQVRGVSAQITRLIRDPIRFYERAPDFGVAVVELCPAMHHAILFGAAGGRPVPPPGPLPRIYLFDPVAGRFFVRGWDAGEPYFVVLSARTPGELI